MGKLLNELPRTHLNWLIASLHNHMLKYGYTENTLPLIVEADIFLVKAGDQIVNNLFTFERGGRLLALRPEFTAAAIHRFISDNSHQVVTRWQFSGDIFTDNNPTEPVSDYQQLAIGAEVIGMEGAVPEAEIIAMSALGLSEIGIHNWEIAIGHAGLTRHILSSFGFDPYIIRFLSQQIPNLRNLELGKNYVRDSIISMLFDRAPSESFDDDYTLNIAQIISEPINNQWMVTNRSASDIARRLREKRARNSLRSTILDALDFLEEWCQIQGAVENVLPELLHALPTRAKSTGVLIKEWGKTLDLLNAYKIPADKIKINPDLTRKWDYYTGTVFELIVDRESIGGGGRYDEFAHLLGSKSNIPAVGFSYYGDMLRKTISTPTSEQTVYNVMVTNAEYLDIAISLSQRLRDLDIHLQISTVPSADNEQMTMIVENETTIKFRNQQYPISQLETLIHLLKI